MSTTIISIHNSHVHTECPNKPCVIFQFLGGTKYRVCEGPWCKKRQAVVKVTVEVAND